MDNVVKMLPGPTAQKKLPHNIDAEQALLGAVLLNNDAFARISDIVTAKDFYEPIHAQIFDIIEFLIGENRVATPISMKGLVGEIEIPGLTASQYLARLAAESTTVINAIDYAKTIKECAVLRELFVFYESQQRRILNGNPKEDSAPKLLEENETFIGDVRPRGTGTGQQFQTFEKAAGMAMDMASAAFRSGSVISGLSTGLSGVDDALGGMNRGDLIVIGGRPGMGKTALATNIAYNVARDLVERRLDKQKTGEVGFFSLEMPADQLASRILAEHSRVSGWRLRKGKVSEAEITSFLESGNVLRNLPIRIDATPALKISQLAMRARALHKRVGLELLVIDYIQLLKGTGGGREINRVNELTEITGTMKELAKEIGIPVIALSQLSRKVEEREDKRPMLSDLRESGSIEQDADSVIFVYREEYYLNKAEPRADTPQHNEWTIRMEAAHGRAEAIIAKNRHGPEATIHLGYNANLTQFNNDVPDKVAASTAAKGKPEKKALLRLKPEANIALKRLQTLVLTNSIENAGHVDDATKGAKLVSYVLWKEKVAAELLDPAYKESDAVTLMKGIVKNLKSPGEGHGPLIGRGGSIAESFVWLVDKK